ncbi:PAS domain S-box protein [Methanolobus halotolerans]|uniref:histidine kinase n=1 Tax=Methanolobus halotolerans TaxID=2052935 RepID=A0A4E0Q412_9EURY|nr:PAS domain S-box protein [Methanolobus halotolerans]TGC08345.1 hypothetical protein CUN85_09735 [Methanolobus halotolerans]
MRNITIIGHKEKANNKLVFMLGKIGLLTHVLNPLENTYQRELINENPDLLFCYAHLNEGIVGHALQYSRDKQIPIVFIVIEFSDDLCQKILSTEYVWYVKEPFEENVLRLIVERALLSVNKCNPDTINEINEQSLQLALETARLQLWEWDFKDDHIIRETTRGVSTVIPLGILNRDFDAFHSFIHPDDRKMFREKVGLCREGKSIHVEFRSIPFEKKTYWHSLFLKPLFGENGKPEKMMGISQDITQRKETEKALKESEEKFRLIAESANDVIWILDRNKKFMYISPSVEKLRGYTPEEVMELPLDKRLTPHSFALIDSILETFFREFKKGIIPDTPRTIEVEQPCKGGSTVWTELHINPVLDDEGNFKLFLGISRDITERRKHEAELQRQKNMLDSIFNLAPTVMLLVNKHGIIEKVNKAAMECTTRDKENIIGHRAGDVFSCINALKGNGCGMNVNCIQCVFKKAEQETLRKRSGVQKKEGTVRFLLPNGSQMSRSFLVSTSYIDMGSEPKIIVSVDDITDIKKIERFVVESKTEAENANRAKSEFLANMSHELRTPLNAIMGYSEILQDRNFGDLSQKQKKFAEHIHTSGKHLLELINNILDISKVESGKMEVHFRELQVLDTMRNVQNVISPLVKKKHIELKFSVDPDKLSLNADEIKFRQILYNLLSNAVKFTPEKGLIKVVARKKDNMAEISVTDTGIGISAEEQSKLFTPFHQIDSSISRKYQGTGLGLALVKRFVELHDGDITVESEPGKGSTFTFTIPIRDEDVLITDAEIESSAD